MLWPCLYFEIQQNCAWQTVSGKERNGIREKNRGMRKEGIRVADEPFIVKFCTVVSGKCNTVFAPLTCLMVRCYVATILPARPGRSCFVSLERCLRCLH